MKRPDNAAAATALIAALSATHAQVAETDRLAEYNARNHVWPPPDEEYKPPTPGWRSLYQSRIRQLEQYDDQELTAKWNGYMVAVHSALLCQNFTENGWGLTKAPQDIVDDLRWKLHLGMVEYPEDEGAEYEEEGNPLFVDIGSDVSNDVLRELKPIHEAWAGVDLVGELAYGLRIYKDGATLAMHADKSATHVISSILHIDHDPMGEPWPLFIEDFHGNLNEVYLESGDMLLYESSKCIHGRPRPFNGAWYSSLFIHYFPTWWDGEKVHSDSTYRIPPTWNELIPRNNDDDALIVRGTSLLQPECEHSWCALKDAKQWRGPVEEGQVLSVGGMEKLNMNRAPTQGPIRQRVSQEDEL